LTATVLLLAMAAGGSAPLRAQNFDLIMLNGRVIDPESGLDAVRSVGISGGKITAVSQDRLSGRRVIDAAGLIVSTGFIDLHSHAQRPETYRLQATDGETSALGLAVGSADR